MNLIEDPLSEPTLQPHPDFMDACTVVGSLGAPKAIVFMHPTHLMVPTEAGGKAFCILYVKCCHRCCGLNICLQNLHDEAVTPNMMIIWRWGVWGKSSLGEVMRVEPMMESEPLWEEEERQSPHSLLCKDTARRCPSLPERGPSPGTHSADTCSWASHPPELWGPQVCGDLVWHPELTDTGTGAKPHFCISA